MRTGSAGGCFKQSARPEALPMGMSQSASSCRVEQFHQHRSARDVRCSSRAVQPRHWLIPNERFARLVSRDVVSSIRLVRVS